MQRLRYLIRDEAGQHCPPELPACVPRERGLYGYGYNHAGQRVYKFFQSDIEGTETTVGYEEEEVPPPGHDVEPVSVGRRAMPNVAPINAVTIHQRFRRFLHAPGGELLAETADGFEEDFPPIQSIYVYLYGVPVSMIRGSQVYDIHTDHLGRPQVVSQNSSARWRAHNAPFHREVLFASIGEMNLGFPGQYYDSESNLYYNWHRYYDPSTGRYTQSDPIGLQGGLNTYAYVGGNPVSLVDPMGLQEEAMFGRPYSFFRLTTFDAARRDVSIDQAVRNGHLTRTVTMPAAGIALAPSALAVLGTLVEPAGAACGAIAQNQAVRETAFAACVTLAICDGRSVRQYAADRDRIQQMAIGISREASRWRQILIPRSGGGG